MVAALWVGAAAGADRAAPEYRIETLAGNGMPGAFPEGGGPAREVPVDLPFGVENGPDRALYITCVGTHRVLRLDPKSGRLTSVAGNGRKGYSGDGGAAIEASLNEPYEVRFDSKGDMLILEMQNHLLRKVTRKTGRISTLAGDGTAGYRGDGGSAREARFHDPHSLILDRQDTLYVSDLSNHRVRRIDARSGRIETVLGNGQRGLPQEGGLGVEQPFLTPQGLAVRGKSLWVASVSGHSLWRLELESGRVYRVAGTGQRGHTGDGGDPQAATFDGPRGIFRSRSGLLYVPEGESNLIREVDPVRRRIRTIAGVSSEQRLFRGDGVPATTAPIWQPHGVCEGKRGELIFSDTRNHRVRVLAP
jgi:hypothetical protein